MVTLTVLIIIGFVVVAGVVLGIIYCRLRRQTITAQKHPVVKNKTTGNDEEESSES